MTITYPLLVNSPYSHFAFNQNRLDSPVKTTMYSVEAPAEPLKRAKDLTLRYNDNSSKCKLNYMA